MFKPLFETTLSCPNPLSSGITFRNAHMTGYARQILGKRLMCAAVIEAARKSNRYSGWAGQCDQGLLRQIGPEAPDQALKTCLAETLAACHRRICAIMLRNQAGVVIGSARHGGNASRPINAAGSVTHYGYRTAIRNNGGVSLSLSDPETGTILGSVTFEMDGTGF